MLTKFASHEIDLRQLSSRLRVGEPPTPKLPENIDDFIRKLSGATQDPNVAFRISDDILNEVISDYKKVHHLVRTLEKSSFSELVLETKRIRQQRSSDSDLLLIALGYLAILNKFSISLHESQIISLLGLLRYNTNVFAQIKTGEGKSFIIGLLGFVLAAKNQSVHVISFSNNLAKRDQEEFFDFYREFGISTSHICDQSPKKNRFQSDIIYGMASDFEFAIMREMLDCKELFPQKPQSVNSRPRFDCVIIDEADNLAIDTVQNSAIMGIPVEESDDWVYIPIFRFVKNHERSRLLPTANALRTFLKEEFLEGHFSKKVDKLTDKKLNEWICSANHAIYELHKEKDYTIGYNRLLSVKEIQVVDAKNTGQIQHGVRWQGGVH